MRSFLMICACTIVSACGFEDALVGVDRVARNSEKFYVLTTGSDGQTYRVGKVGLVTARRGSNALFEGIDFGRVTSFVKLPAGEIEAFLLRPDGEFVAATYTTGVLSSSSLFGLVIHRTRDLEQTVALSENQILEIATERCDFEDRFGFRTRVIEAATERRALRDGEEVRFDRDRPFDLTWSVPLSGVQRVRSTGWAGVNSGLIIEMDVGFLPRLEQDGIVFVNNSRDLAARDPFSGIWSAQIFADGTMANCAAGTIIVPVTQPVPTYQITPDRFLSSTGFTIDRGPEFETNFIIRLGGLATVEDAFIVPGEVTHLEGPFRALPER